jgi:hypothetical protein
MDFLCPSMRALFRKPFVILYMVSIHVRSRAQENCGIGFRWQDFHSSGQLSNLQEALPQGVIGKVQVIIAGSLLNEFIFLNDQRLIDLF